MEEKKMCPETQHCFCTPMVVNQRDHFICCNCGHQKSKRILDRYLDNVPVLDATRQTPIVDDRYAFGSTRNS